VEGARVTSPLVSTAWLATRLADPGVKIIDASWFMPGTPRDAAAEFALRHIPGAVFFGIDEIKDHASDLPHMLASPSEFAVAARRLGLNNADDIVVYDSLGLFSAPRVWWNFRVMGHERTFVLDGGLPAWQADGHPIETGWPHPEHGDFKSRFDASLVAGAEEVREALDSVEPQIVDARAADRFTGEAPEPRAGLKSGHMPGARNAPWSAMVAEGALAEPAQLKAAFEAAGVDLAAPIITTCGSGVSAALLALALAQLGRPDVAVYDGSWSEWGALQDAPIATGPA
jgi:thiosulfate/3-mercaptopyruvate sulfurtransferase